MYIHFYLHLEEDYLWDELEEDLLLISINIYIYIYIYIYTYLSSPVRR